MAKPQPIVPRRGMLLTYKGRAKNATRNVRVVAEASGDRVVVEAIGAGGGVVRLTVKRQNLFPLQPELFDSF